MCIICAKPKGIKLPDHNTIATMFDNNPHGAGIMFARGGKVEICKGLMNLDEFEYALRFFSISDDDSTVFHFRISTQAGVSRFMTHPFPWTQDYGLFTKLDMTCRVGIVHNGIIRFCSDLHEKKYNDTCKFIAEYLPYIVRREEDFTDPSVKTIISNLTNSRFAFLLHDGRIETCGDFLEDGGIFYSNNSYKPKPKFTFASAKGFTYQPVKATKTFTFADDDDDFSWHKITD